MLKLSKALLAKKRYVALKDDVSPEVFLDRAFEATEALKEVVSEMSPNSNREPLSVERHVQTEGSEPQGIQHPKDNDAVLREVVCGTLMA